MLIIQTIILLVVGLVIGGVIGYFYRKALGKKAADQSEAKAERILADAKAKQQEILLL